MFTLAQGRAIFDLQYLPSHVHGVIYPVKIPAKAFSKLVS